jgi:hypothetical protein
MFLDIALSPVLAARPALTPRRDFSHVERKTRSLACQSRRVRLLAGERTDRLPRTLRHRGERTRLFHCALNPATATFLAGHIFS